MNRMKGITIIQLMIFLFIAGIIGAIAVKLLVEKRCEAGGPEKLCKDRNASRTK